MSKLPPISEMDVDCECMEVSDDSARRDTIVDVGNSDVSMSVSLMLARMKKESLEKSKGVFSGYFLLSCLSTFT